MQIKPPSPREELGVGIRSHAKKAALACSSSATGSGSSPMPSTMANTCSSRNMSKAKASRRNANTASGLFSEWQRKNHQRPARPARRQRRRFRSKAEKEQLTAQGIALGSFCHKRNAPYRGKSNPPTPSDTCFHTPESILSHPRINAFAPQNQCFHTLRCMLSHPENNAFTPLNQCFRTLKCMLLHS